MILPTEQICIGEPVAEAARPVWQLGEYTGIPSVDSKLQLALRDGGLVLVSGYTSSGKTVLAGQIASCMAMEGKKVAFLSTEVQERELAQRSLACLAEWPYGELLNGFSLEDRGALRVPVLSPNSDEFSGRARRPFRMLEKHLDFRYLPDFAKDPSAILMDAVTEILSGKVDCLILDYVRIDGLVGDEPVSMQPVNIPDVANEVINLLGEVARERGIPVFVFCQRNHAEEGQSKREAKAGRVGRISEFPSIEKLADATIELTHPVSRPIERHENPSTGTFSPSRHFIMTVNGGGESWVSVTADFAHQRFVSRVEESENDAESDREFRKRVKNSERPGFIKFPREVWEKILQIRHIPTRIVYVAMVLNADLKTGNSHWSGPGLERLLSMDDSVIRRALSNLTQLGLIALNGGGGRGKLREWHVVDYVSRFQNFEARDYVVLARNLLDVCHAPLREDNDVFAVWIHLLFDTRFSKDVDGDLDRGQWPGEYLRMANVLKMDVERVKVAIDRLEELGCLNRWTDEDWGREIIMLPNYDRYQRMVPWSAKNPERTNPEKEADEPLQKDGRTTDELGTNNGRTADKLQTNHGQ